MPLFGVRGRKVEREGVELAGSEGLVEVVCLRADDDDVRELGFHDELGRVGHADGLLVHPDKERLGLAGGPVADIGAFAASKIEMQALKRLATLPGSRFAPTSGKLARMLLDSRGIALKALLEDEVLRRANAGHGVGSPKCRDGTGGRRGQIHGYRSAAFSGPGLSRAS